MKILQSAPLCVVLIKFYCIDEKMNKTRNTHEQLKKKALLKPGVKKEYDALEEEFILLDILVSGRRKIKKCVSLLIKTVGRTKGDQLCSTCSYTACR